MDAPGETRPIGNPSTLVQHIPKTPRAILHEVQRSLESIYPRSEAQAIAREVVEHTLGRPFHRILLDNSTEVPDAEREKLQAALRRLLAHEPVQYVVGATSFCDLSLHVTPAVLIPRPETELLTLALCKLYQGRAPRVADLGTGSGAIAITLAARLPYAQVEAFDISAEALAVAAENAARCGVRVDFSEMDILSPRFHWPKEAWHLIVSNPPYVPASREKELAPNVTRYEPRQALYVPDSDPLLFYRAILRQGKPSLREGGIMAFEIDCAFATPLEEQARNEGYESISIVDDFADKPRFLLAAKEQGNAFVQEFKRIVQNY